MEKQILITGGAGFIGSAIFKELNQSNNKIYVIDDLSFGNRNFINIEGQNFFKNDIRDREKIEKIILDINPDWIIHLAAIHFIPYCNENPYEAADINILGTMNILEAAKKCSNLKKFFFASTAAVYPIYDEAVTEGHEVKPLDIYGLTKQTGEHLCKKFFLEKNIDTVICRFFNAFGPNETNPHLIPEIQEQINSGKRTIQLGNLEPKRDFIHTYDMARAVRMLMETDDIGYDTFNLGRGIEYSVKEIVDAFERELGEKITIETDPKRVRKTDRMHLLADVSKLKEKTGWEPEWGIDEGIRTMIK